MFIFFNIPFFKTVRRFSSPLDRAASAIKNYRWIARAKTRLLRVPGGPAPAGKASKRARQGGGAGCEHYLNYPFEFLNKIFYKLEEKEHLKTTRQQDTRGKE